MDDDAARELAIQIQTLQGVALLEFHERRRRGYWRYYNEPEFRQRVLIVQRSFEATGTYDVLPPWMLQSLAFDAVLAVEHMDETKVGP